MSARGAVQTRHRVQVLEVVLTANCNLRCSYCYQNRKAGRRIDPGTLNAALAFLAGSSRREVELVLIGGEPLMEFDLFRYAVERAEAMRIPGKRLAIRTVTNGTLLDDAKSDFLAAHGIDTDLSFDGVPAAQDLRARGTFRRLDRLLDRLRGDHPEFFDEKLSVAITLTGANLHLLEDSVRYFTGKGVRKIMLGPCQTSDRRFRPGDIQELDRQMGRVFRFSLAHYRRTGRIPFAPFRRTRMPRGRRVAHLEMCHVARGRGLAVDVDGQVHGCVSMATSYQELPPGLLRESLGPMRLGHIRDPALPARLAGLGRATRHAPIFDDKQDKYSSYGRCADCRFLDECVVCPLSIGHIAGNVDPRRIPDLPCALNLIVGKYRARFPLQTDPLDWITGRARLPRGVRNILHRVVERRAVADPDESKAIPGF